MDDQSDNGSVDGWLGFHCLPEARSVWRPVALGKVHHDPSPASSLTLEDEYVPWYSI